MSFIISQAIAAGSLASLFFSMQAIQNVKYYESIAKKAAQYSSEADDQLWQTRVTEAAGTLSSLMSLGSALALAYPKMMIPPGLPVFAIGIGNAALLYASSIGIAKFWATKQRVPGARKYNDAIYQTNTVKQLLWGLTGMWVAAAFYLVIFENE